MSANQPPGGRPVVARPGPFAARAQAAARNLRKARLLDLTWRQTSIAPDDLDMCRCYVGPSVTALISRDGKIKALFDIAPVRTLNTTVIGNQHEHLEHKTTQCHSRSRCNDCFPHRL
jgi:hypothetical protein